MPLNARGRQPEGVLVILQDRTEALKLSDELSGARNMMDTLRAFNHEFLNKLHIILGYLHNPDFNISFLSLRVNSNFSVYLFRH